MKLHPFYECVRGAEQQMARGGVIYQQFNCAGCGQKLTMDEANVFHKTGTCDQCDVVTDIEKDGCNYMVHFHFGGDHAHKGHKRS